MSRRVRLMLHLLAALPQSRRALDGFLSQGGAQVAQGFPARLEGGAVCKRLPFHLYPDTVLR